MSAFLPLRLNWSQLVSAALLLLFVAFVARHFGQAITLEATLRRGRPAWIPVAVALQGLTLLNQPALYQSLYALVGLRVRWRELVPVVCAAHFVNIVTPAARLGGTALLLVQARRRGLDMGRVALANTLYFLFNFVVFVLLLGASLVFLFVWRDLKTYEILIAAIPMTGVILALAALWLVGARPRLFERLVLAVGRGVNALGHRFWRRQL